MMQAEYVNAVRLLLNVLPSIFKSGNLALKGGTAINLYLDDMPRLSVDIDAVFLPLGLTRDEALHSINNELIGITHALEGTGLWVNRNFAEGVNESQLLVRNSSAQVKIEINTVFRGAVLPPKLRLLSQVPSDIFAIDVPAMLLDPAEIYAGKILAALDRQHPRDLFDIWRLYQKGSLTDAILDVFAVYLCAHNRPPNEILGTSNKNINEMYRNSLVGMIRMETPTVNELVEVRERLRNNIITGLSKASRSFIIDFFSGEPQWDLLPFKHLMKLPALQWKLQNLAQFKLARPSELDRQNAELISLLK